MTKEVKKLWQIDTPLHPLVQQYTAGDDVIYDQKLLPYDVIGSKAHAKMLAKQGILSEKECKSILDALDQLLEKWQKGQFVITAEQEDCHTAIENFLTETLGDTGKKIHTGRSRNDQTTLMVRLFVRDELNKIIAQTNELVSVTRKSAKHLANLSMPGYTHMQKAMPTTVEIWLESFADAWADSVILLVAVKRLIDQNPLGSASGFGIKNFDNDREFTTRELGFSKVQENPQYVGLSRGLFEHAMLQALGQQMLIHSRFASDMMIFTTKEFNFFSLPSEFTTGSSIMPNKRNYDLFEIMRANVSVVLAEQQQVAMSYTKLMSGYNRDLQTMKAPLMHAIKTTQDTLELLIEIMPNITPNKQTLKASMTDDLFVTQRVYELVNQGMAFRDAYLTIKKLQ